MRLRSVSLLALLVLAGCAGPEESDSDLTTGFAASPTDTLPPAFDFDAGIKAPTWNVGDWWHYSIEYNSGDKFDARIVVYKMEGATAHITSDSRDLVLRAVFNHYPNISPVTTSSLDQTIHGVKVAYLKFPMKNQTWSAQYRDFQMNYATQYATLDAGTEKVPGFTTTMNHAVDGRLRMSHGWSPVTKWFTDFTWDFDGNAPIDVKARLVAWGSNFTGTLPVVELVEIAHRAFPATAAPPAAQPPSTPPPGNQAFKVGTAGSTLVVGMFAGAGGPGSFQLALEQQGGTAAPTRYEWQPSGAGSHFQWNRIQNPAVGDWQLAASGAAQNSAFLFVEAYEAKTTEITLAT